MARLYADEDFPLPVVEELRRLGHDVRTVQEAGRANQGIDVGVLRRNPRKQANDTQISQIVAD
jgi:Domain of unknown function (DUF5615)